MRIQKTAAEHSSNQLLSAGRPPLRALIAGKRHVQECLASALWELGVISCAPAAGDRLAAVLSDFRPNIFLMAVSPETSTEAASTLEELAQQGAGCKVILLGPKECPFLAEFHSSGEALGLTVMEPLLTPICYKALSSLVHKLRGESVVPGVDLLAAIDSDWLELWYQPKYNIQTFRMEGAEALIRMRHPKLGVIEPAHFIPYASDEALVALSDFVIDRSMSDWRLFSGVSQEIELAINIPLKVLSRWNCMQSLIEKLPQDYRFRRGLIETDAADVIDDPSAAKCVASELTHHQLALSVDDVDEDWIELYAIEDAPIAEIKVDRSLVAGCAKNLVKQSVCKRIIEFAHGIEVRTVAEGIETRPDLLTAREIGFDLVQGHVCGRPVDRKQFVWLLKERWCAAPQYARAA